MVHLSGTCDLQFRHLCRLFYLCPRPVQQTFNWLRAYGSHSQCLKLPNTQTNEYFSATHIIRAGANTHSMTAVDSTSALGIMHVVNRIIASSNESAQNRTKACFILSTFTFPFSVSHYLRPFRFPRDRRPTVMPHSGRSRVSRQAGSSGQIHNAPRPTIRMGGGRTREYFVPSRGSSISNLRFHTKTSPHVGSIEGCRSSVPIRTDIPT